MKRLRRFLYAALAAAFCYMPNIGVAAAPDAQTMVCRTCHSAVTEAFATDRHHRAWSAVTDPAQIDQQCNQCHQVDRAHLSAPRDASHVRRLRSPTAAITAAVCGACHQHKQSRAMDAHRQAEVACTACHSIHKAAPRISMPGILAKLDPASATCYQCHAETFTTFTMNHSHRLTQGSIACTDCHDPHQPTPPLRLGGFQDDTCTRCHGDKAGPFVFEHAAGRVEGCTACHTPHGSANRHLLTHQLSGELCYSCHATVPQFHVGFSPSAPPRFDQRTVCTNCHVAVHGSNLDRNFLR